MKKAKRLYNSLGSALAEAGYQVQTTLPRAESDAVDILLLQYYAGKGSVSVISDFLRREQVSSTEAAMMRSHLRQVSLKEYLDDKTKSYDQLLINVVDLVSAGGHWHLEVCGFLDKAGQRYDNLLKNT